MRKLLLTTTAITAVLSAAPAFAADTDINQAVFGLQAALDVLVSTNGGDAASQAATNAANLVNVNADQYLRSVDQFSGSWQSAVNVIYTIDNAGPTDDWGDVSQEAVNVSNSIVSDHGVGSIDQKSLDWQLASNNFAFGDGYLGTTKGNGNPKTTQAATNAANIVSVDTIDGTGFFIWSDGADQDSFAHQKALNLAGPGFGAPYAPDGSVDVRNFGQEATNVANSISVDTSLPTLIGTDVSQFAISNQVASNVLVGADYVNNIAQTATNVVNSINVGSDD